MWVYVHLHNLQSARAVTTDRRRQLHFHSRAEHVAATYFTKHRHTRRPLFSTLRCVFTVTMVLLLVGSYLQDSSCLTGYMLLEAINASLWVSSAVWCLLDELKAFKKNLKDSIQMFKKRTSLRHELKSSQQSFHLLGFVIRFWDAVKLWEGVLTFIWMFKASSGCQSPACSWPPCSTLMSLHVT